MEQKVLLAGQDQLQRLPVPELDATLQKYLRTIEPLFPAEVVGRTRALAEDFSKDVGPRLQQLLVERDQKEPRSWLIEWWDRVAYLEYRASNVINSNFSMPFRPFPGSLLGQCQRAALLCRAALEYKKMVDTETLVPDKQPNDQEAHTRLFNACRIPQPVCDGVRRFSWKEVHHVVVVCRDVFWVLDHGKNGLPNVCDLERDLEEIVRRSAGGGPAVGALTYLGRDDWTPLRASLVELGNAKSLELIESAAFVLCLDEGRPEGLEDMFKVALMGDALSCSNRWYDKPVELIVCANGEAGLNGEHSPVDGEIVARMVEWILEREVELHKDTSREGGKEGRESVAPIGWTLDTKLHLAIREAVTFAAAQIKDLQVRVLEFRWFGSGGIVKHKLSPDAWFQAALQLSYYRLHNRFAPTYESVSTRRFRAGRTETGRVLSTELAEFVRAMENPRCGPEGVRQALIRAADAHVSYMKEAGQGRGVDRHLLGLRKLAAQHNISHPFLTDSTLTESGHWRLSTSQLKVTNLAVGFGPVVEDGYGCCYQIHKNHIVVALTSFRRNKDTSAERLACQLEKALLEMQALFSMKANL